MIDYCLVNKRVMTVMIRTHDVGRGLGAEFVRVEVEVDIVEVREDVMGVDNRLVDEFEEGEGVDGPGDSGAARGAKRVVWLDDEVVGKGGSPSALGNCKSLRE